MQKYRADVSKPQPDGAVIWSAQWQFGPSLAKIANCRLAHMAGNMRRTVYITGEADTWFSIPAVCKIAGCRVRGYVTGDDETGDDETGDLVFRHVYY